MTDSPEFEHATYDEFQTARSNRPGGRIAWIVLVAIGLVIYELTAQAALGAVVACAKFGWDDFATGWWLRRHVQQPQGRVCSWFHFAAAFWRVAVAAAIAVFLIALLSAALEGAQKQQRPLPNDVAMLLGVILLESLAGFALSGFVTSLAVVSAVRRRVRVWIDNGIHQARRDRVWPPHTWHGNRVGVLLFGTAFVLPLPPLVAVFALIAPFAPPVLNALFAILLLAFGWPVLILCIRDMLLRRVAAGQPEICWSAETERY